MSIAAAIALAGALYFTAGTLAKVAHQIAGRKCPATLASVLASICWAAFFYMT